MTVPGPTPSFDHRRRGTAAAAWTAAVDALPGGAEVGPHDHVVVLAPHPDDETLGAGALLAGAAACGAQITVIVATDGERSHPDSVTVAPAELARLRRAELADAIGRLAPSARVVRLGLPDGRLGEHPSELSSLVADAARDATVVVTTWRDDGHPDHRACGEAAAALCAARRLRLLEFPIWAWHWGRPGDAGPLLGPRWVARRVRGGERSAKSSALAAYRSQTGALSPQPGDEPVLEPDFLEHFHREVEVFTVAERVNLPAAYFERLYAAEPDPWGVTERFYEQRKRALLTASLPRPRFGSAFEPGCGLGFTTRELAQRCDRVLAMDASDRAAEQTRTRTAGYGTVEVRTGAVPADWPAGRFDLVVISELGYYLAEPRDLAERARASLTDDGVLVACHWRHPAPGYPSSADEVHAALARGLHNVVTHVEADFRLDVWSRDGRSVAESDGIVSAS